MWFSGFFFKILFLTVEVYLRWKWQISPFFVSGTIWKISSVSNTYLPHCMSTTIEFPVMLSLKINKKYIL